jgi:ABC-type multidrug transport system fused ATPase/permease subunit
MVSKILFSLVITSLVSTLAGLIYVSQFWIIFGLAFILQVLFFYFLNSIYENKLIEKAQKLKLEEYKELTKHIILIECPCADKAKQDVEVRFDKELIYKCNKCDKNIRALPDIKTVLQTDPIYFNDRAR